MNLRMRTYPLVFAVIVSTLPALGRAADYTWDTQSGDWSDAANWLNGAVPVNDPSTQIILMGVPEADANLTSTVDAGRAAWVLNGLTLEHPTNGSSADQVTIDPASTLQFAGAGAFIDQESSTATVISGPISLASDLNFLSQGGGAVTLAGPISGSGGIIYGDNFANLTLAGSNSFTGGLTISPAASDGDVTVNIASPAALGSGNLTINHPSSDLFPTITIGLQAGSGSSTTIANNIVVNSLESSPILADISFNAIGAPANYTYTLQHVFTNGSAAIAFTQDYTSTSPVNWNIQSLTLNGNLTFGGGAVTIGSISESQPSALITSAFGESTLTLTGANNYSGGTVISGLTTINADADGALGSGNVAVAGTLYLNATNAARGTFSGTGVVYYAANGAAGGNSIAVSNVVLSNAVTSFSNGIASDSFNIGNGTLTGDGATLALLNRGIGSGTTPNFIATAGAMIENTDGGLPTIQNLGANADLVPIVHTSSPLTVPVGTGTPWEGFAGGSTVAFVGSLVGNSNFFIAQGLFGNGTAASFNILAPAGGSPVSVTVQNATISSPLSDYSGVANFFVGGTLTLNTPNALGGGNSSAPVSANVTGTLVAGDPAAINANVTLQPGSTLSINAPGLSGTGTITHPSGPVTLTLGYPGALTGTQINGSFLQAGDSVDLAATNIVGLKNLNPMLNFVMAGFSAMPEAEGFTINGGSLFFANPQQSLTVGPAAQGDSIIHVGTYGATIAGFGTFSPSVDGHDPISSSDSGIAVPLQAIGTVNFGYPGTAPSNASGAIVLANPANQFGTVDINNMTLVAFSPATLTGAAITLKGGQLALLSNVTNSSLPPTLYNNIITVAQDATITDNLEYINPFSIFPRPLADHAITLPTINLASATLTLDSAFGMGVNTLHLTGNGTILVISSPPVSLALTNISDDGAFPSLSLQDTSVAVTGSLTAAGPINLSNVTFEFDGTSTPSAAPITLGAGSVLGGVGVLHRPVVFASNVSAPNALEPGASGNPTFGPFHIFLPGTFTVDSLALSSSTHLVWSLGMPNVVGGSANDLVIDDGDLTLDGVLAIEPGANFGPGAYTILTYGGTLTNDGLLLQTLPGYSLALDLSSPGQVNLIVAAATPEPATLALSLPAALALLWRRRKPRNA